jgi:hypothetical protein
MTYYHSHMQQKESECMVMSKNDQKVRISNDFYSVCPTVESTGDIWITGTFSFQFILYLRVLWGYL